MKNYNLITRTMAVILFISSIVSCEDILDNKDMDPLDAQAKTYEWKMTTTWRPKPVIGGATNKSVIGEVPNKPVIGDVANKYAQWVEKMSDGQMKIKVYASGELVPALEAFDSVSNGTIEMGVGASHYWTGKTPAAQFFAAVPFGMNDQQLNSWLETGGGYELWKKTYAQFNLVPFSGGNSGVQMGGWFNKEINSVNDFKGLKMRLPGIAGKVLEKAGGSVVSIAGGEVYTSLERGVIDATGWMGPCRHYKRGFYKIAKYYYTPGWHKPGTQFDFFVNKEKYDALPKHLQVILEVASKKAQAWVLTEFDRQNAIYLDQLLNEEGVKIKEFSEETLNALREYTDEALSEMIGDDPLTKEIYESYTKFQKRTVQ